MREGGNVGQHLATSKANEWEYEAEVRLVAQLMKARTLAGLDEISRFLSFDPKALLVSSSAAMQIEEGHGMRKR